MPDLERFLVFLVLVVDLFLEAERFLEGEDRLADGERFFALFAGDSLRGREGSGEADFSSSSSSSLEEALAASSSAFFAASSA